MTILLRDAAEGDVETVTTMIRAGFAEYEGKLDPPSGAHAETPEKVRAKMAMGGAVMAFIDSVCVGVVLFYPEDGFLYLGRLAVLPDYRALGVGKVLIEAVESKAQALGLPGVQLSVRLALPRNRTYFENMGYQVVSYHTHPDYSEPTFMTLEKRFSP